MPARILVATAEPSLQRLLSDSVRGDGHDVLPTTTGPDALRRWTLDQPDLVILDAELAGFDGYELVHRIRGAEAVGAHVPMVMLGADQDVQAKVRGLRAGADDYLVKPFHPT
ncbi:MAG: response regulator, partial [Candidatus Limnocylindrales bacterium]